MKFAIAALSVACLPYRSAGTALPASSQPNSDLLVPLRFDNPWPERLPFYIQSIKRSEVRLAIAQYGVDLPTMSDWKNYIDEAFEYLGYAVENRWGPSAFAHNVNDHLREWGGNKRMILEFWPKLRPDGTYVPLDYAILIEQINTMWRLFTDRTFRELACLIQIDEVDAGILFLQKGSHSITTSPVKGDLSEAFQSVFDHLRPPGLLSPWMPAPYDITIPSHHQFTFRVERYGEAPPAGPGWWSHVDSAFAGMIGDIEKQYSQAKPSHVVDKSLVKETSDQILSLEFTPSLAGSSVEKDVLQDILYHMWSLFDDRQMREVYGVVRDGERNAASLNLRVLTSKGPSEIQSSPWPQLPFYVPALDHPGDRLKVFRYLDNIPGDAWWRKYLSNAFATTYRYLSEEYSEANPLVDEDFTQFDSTAKIIELSFTVGEFAPDFRALQDLLRRMEKLYDGRTLRELRCVLELDGTASGILALRAL